MKPTANRSNKLSMRQGCLCEPPVKRPNYFTGQILSAEDFTAEQEYHKGKQRRHNLHCPGFFARPNQNPGSRWESAFFLERLCNPVPIVSDATSLSSQTYPEAETTRIYFRGSEVVCLSSEDKTCQAIRSDPAKQEGIFRGASVCSVSSRRLNRGQKCQMLIL